LPAYMLPNANMPANNRDRLSDIAVRFDSELAESYIWPDTSLYLKLFPDSRQ
jgi:hypothetical protein